MLLVICVLFGMVSMWPMLLLVVSSRQHRTIHHHHTHEWIEKKTVRVVEERKLLKG